MECPRDHSILRAEPHQEKVEIDRCPTCRGVWLDRGELQTLQDGSAQDQPHVAYAANVIGRSVEEFTQLRASDVSCPRCGTVMSHRRYGFGSQVVIDICLNDCGVWLDAGELQQLEALYEQSQLDCLEVLPVSFWLRERLYALLSKRREG
jgi:Zn-finger nucleic acid-binding protein